MPRKKSAPISPARKAAQMRNFGIFRIRGAYATIANIDISPYTTQQKVLLIEAQDALAAFIKTLEKTNG